MSGIFIVARRVVKQLLRNRRFLALSVVAPLIIIYFLKLFFDTLPPTIDPARYAVPVAAFLVHFLSFILCAIVLVQERTAGTLERMFVNGFTRTEIIGGYVLGYLGLATVQAVVVLTEVLWLFGLGYSSNRLLLMFGIIWLLAIASVMLGIFISTFARNESQVLPFIPLVIVPSVFLSGLLVSTDLLPAWAQWIGKALPLFYANRAVQRAVQPDSSLTGTWSDIGVLILYSVVLLVLASRTLSDVE